MSLVEIALKKLQATAGSVHTPARSARPPTVSAGRVVRVDRPEPRDRGQPQLRLPVGNATKTIQIDHDALRANGLLPPESQERELAHQYRTVKRPLIKHAFRPDAHVGGPAGGSVRSIMISSALPGEGKTFTAVNLALSMALEKDHSVLLVDGDVAKPHISHTFGLADEPGLLDVLADPSRPIESVVLPTDVPGLSILPVGRRSDTATELLASARMQEMIRNLEQLDPQGIVLVDSPPILLTSEARVLAQLFGQVVLVVRANNTPQQAVLEAIHLIGEGPQIRLVLNQATHVGSSSGYYGYGSYGYGYGYGKDQSSTAGDASATSADPPG